MARLVDITGDVNVDAESHRVFAVSAGRAPVEEGDFCGLLFAGERGADGYVPVNVTVNGATEAEGLPLGVRDWSGGAVELDADTTTGEAIDRINKALAEVEPDIDAGDVPLGGAPEDWPEGAVELTPEVSSAEAFRRINEKIKQVDEKPAGPQDGFHLNLGTVEDDGDGSWEGGAVPLTNDTPVSEAVDRLNEVLGKLVPTQPPAFPNGTLSVSNTAGSQARLAEGYTYNDGTALTPGTAVTRITAAGVSSGNFNDVGPGDSGTLTAILNGEVAATRDLTGTGDNGNYDGLVVSDQKDYPVSTPGFWKSIDVSLTLLAAPVGLNAVRIAHSGAGQTNLVTFMRDDMTANPALSGGSVAQAALGTPAYSSGVPHYGADAYLTVGLSIANLAGETYYGGADPIQFTGPVISTKTISYDAAEIEAPIARGTLAPVAIEPQTISVDGSGHTSGKISGVARNVNGSASADLGGPTILIKRGSAGARIDENSISGPGTTAVRKGSAAGDRPAGAPAAWNSASALPAHEAAVVAGVLAHNRTDYSDGYLPVGPDLSTGRDGAQYVTLSFSRAALSTFKIVVAGSYAGCWVKLPGVTDDAGIAPNAQNGWMNAFAAYDGAGVPGKTGDTAAGCALGAPMAGAGGTYTITFGTESSTNADGNEVLIRFRLNAGQSITALSFTT